MSTSREISRLDPATRSVPEPAKAKLVARGVSQREAAELIGISVPLVCSALNSRIVPPPRLREGLSVLLGEPDEALWHPSTLARVP